MSAARYAVFYCPEDSSELGLYGQQVLGRSADGQVLESAYGDCPDWQQASALSATPAHYGFHATLKAPFHLAECVSEQQLLDAVETLACRQTVIAMQTIRPRLLSGFVALTLQPQSQAIATLAELCVTQFEPYRAPLSQDDILKRKPDQLTERQREYLYQYGYPHVMSEFRFHMTLSGQIVPGEHEEHVRWLTELFDKHVLKTPVLDRLAVFWQPDRETPFVRLAQFAFS